MRTLTVDELDAGADAYDAAVMEAVGLDRFCSSSDWVIPAARALMPARSPWIQLIDEVGYVAMMRGRHGSGWRYLEPLEALWGLACPLVGSDPETLSEAMIELLAGAADQWDVMVLSGVLLDSELEHALRPRLERRYEVAHTSQTTRHLASLEGGVDGWLSRRTRQFRKSLRKADRRCREAGVCWESVRLDPGDDADALYDRVLDIERTSWKGRAGLGIDQGNWSDFYRLMVRRMVARGAQRALFAKIDDRDVAYVLGGMFAGAYRGLQMSYHSDYEALGLGNASQLRQIEELCGEGVPLYDMGTGMEYKPRWAEQVVESPVLLVVRT
jgi:CelD/BcsL family acetyltransferase involved in cellulose biosynthesis